MEVLTLLRSRPTVLCSFVMMLTGCTAAVGSKSDTGTEDTGGAGGTGADGASNASGGNGSDLVQAATVVRRLNRTEYDNTVRDLLGTTQKPARRFPEDGRSAGFDNQGEALTISPELSELYVQTAQTLVEEFVAGQTPQKQALFTCDAAANAACRIRIVEAFARRAWRRPPANDDLARILPLLDLPTEHGDGPIEGLKLALAAVLASPRFLFKLEVDPSGKDANGVRRLDGYELASRLSYFLWSSMPDEPLAAAAADATLLEERTLRAQVARMLADAKADALVSNFGSQWLHITRLDQHEVESTVLQSFSPELRASMRAETEAFLKAVLREDLPVTALLTADFSVVDARLANHYGLPVLRGSAPERVTLTNTARRGLLSHASLLTVTSLPDRTSPSSRGKWVLDQLLCEPPPPPPPDIPALPKEATTAQSVRQRLEEHRTNPACKGCHELVDPIGFALERFDGVGRSRDKDGNVPIDTSAELVDGTRIDGAASLAESVANDERFLGCVTKQAYAYAVGRKAGPADDSFDGAAVERIVSALRTGKPTLAALFSAIATSESFTTRRVAVPAGDAP